MLSKSFNSRRVFKEKIVQLYIEIIKKEELFKNNSNFWNEFFLLKANGNALEQELKKSDNFADIQSVTNLLFSKCLVAIKDSNQLRVLNGLITLCSISHFVLHGPKTNFHSETITSILIGKDYSYIFKDLIECLTDLLFSNVDTGIKGIVLKLLLIFATLEKNVNENEFMQFLAIDKMFDALINLLNSPSQFGNKILLLLIIFLNYDNDNTNSFQQSLSILDNELLLSGYFQVISTELINFNQKFDRICADSKSGIFSTLSNMMGTIFSGDDANVDISSVMGKKSSLYPIKIVLLAFYEAVLLNRNFVSLLTTSPPDSFLQKNDEEKCLNADNTCISTSLPQNLLVAFLEFTSIIMLDMKDESTLHTNRLCFIILTCITEDSCANSIIHDNNMAFIVNLQQMPMRHRKIPNAYAKGLRPLSHVILDLMTEFILSHMNRNIQYDLFFLCLGIILRLISFQKRCHVRIAYNWKELWSALTTLLKFFIGNESYFLKHQLDIFTLSIQVINLFNIFIMFGDNFLATTDHYDQLYYEIIRTFSVFDNINSLALRYMTKENNCFKERATKLTQSLINVKAIIAHFNTKIEKYSSQNQLVTLSEEQVLEVVRSNYDTLTVKIQENVDQFEPFDPAKTSEFNFLMKLLTLIIEDYACNKSSTVGPNEQYILVQNIQSVNSTITSMQYGHSSVSPDLSGSIQ